MKVTTFVQRKSFIISLKSTKVQIGTLGWAADSVYTENRTALSEVGSSHDFNESFSFKNLFDFEMRFWCE